jgi:hypothetical protein
VRLLAAPLLVRLAAADPSTAGEPALHALLESWRDRPPVEQGYGPGTVVNLLRLARGHVRGLDLAHLSLRQVYLAVEAQDVNLAGAHLVEAVLAEPFEAAVSTALSADGRYLAAGTINGDVRLWRVTDRTPVVAVAGHAGAVWRVALSADGQLLASGGGDDAVRLWEASSGRCLAVLQGHTGGVWSVALSADGRLLASGRADSSVRLWDARSHARIRTLRPDRLYERTDITGLTGVTTAQRDALLALGAVDRSTDPSRA